MSKRMSMIALAVSLTAMVLAGFCLSSHQSKVVRSAASAVWGS
jgi:hypothetical protein